ncbi:MAG: TetR/AcrR family transcriptional regulator [Candidatus Abyssobacteria bacterium SURF_5]|uniref:TetR/AcrR family transcriptional regulator n=1 Tax=Abyssobacteria bacterium (strain SURF_5) TaxID=2093360 RepID=A0A3A4NLB9_ABYX5|nr:MAG: TetR/AcrR family transcriptional regulator [Candidatus Abyssubacteria bacterium SURF_5]
MGARLRREQERQARWEQIVDAARKVFSQKGFYRATIEDIERESRLTRGAIYYHFHSKEEIYISILVRGMRILRDELKVVIRDSDLDPEALILNLVDTYCDFCKHHHEYFRILDHFYSGWDCEEGLRAELVEEVNRLIYECLAEVVEVMNRGIQVGNFHVENPLLEAVLMWSMIGNALRKTTENPRALFLGIDWNTMQDGLRRNIIGRLRGVPRGVPVDE